MSWQWGTALLVTLWGVFSPIAGKSHPLPHLPILCYHKVSPNPSSEYEVSLKDFLAQMRYLQEKGYVTISLQQWIRALERATSLPAQPVVLTFDDGHISGYESIFPVLRAYGFTGTFFVSTGLLSSRQSHYLNWSHLCQMAREGVDIMPHGHSHLNLTKRIADEAEGSYRTRVREELIRSKNLIESRLHRPCPFFAYPYGAYDEEVEKIAMDADFDLILTASPGINTALTNPYRLKRQLIYRDDGVEGFGRKLGAHPLQARFPFEEGTILPGSPPRIQIDLPYLSPPSNPPILLLDRKEVASSFDPAAMRVSFVPPEPIPPGVHLLELRIIEEEGGRWYQDSTLFAIRPHQPGARPRD